MNITPPDKKLFFSKKDSQDLRLGDLVKEVTQESNAKEKFDFILLGYPDDTGIIKNNGRSGAKSAPIEIRKALYKLTPDPRCGTKIKLGDLGNVKMGTNINKTLSNAKEALMSILKLKSSFPICLGGGHDFAFADISGLIESSEKKEKIGLINIDAHLDVRELNNGMTSGTPFRALLELKNIRLSPYNFIEFGIQSHCNSKNHIAFVKRKGGKVFFLDEIASPTEQFSDILSTLTKKVDKIAISLDIDSINMSEAPGASASYPTGFRASDIVKIIKEIAKNDKINLLGIYEVSPRFDIDNRTSKLAAKIIHTFISSR